jgi:hypothetical protein
MTAQFNRGDVLRRRVALPRLESLERRTLLAASLANLPAWTPQGPGPILYAGGLVTNPDSRATGAIQSFAVDPNNPEHMLVGAVNGGVWETYNADPSNPTAITWTPLTDNLPSLAIASVAFDTSDPSGKSFFAGTGSLSNEGGEGGAPVGLYHTTDDGASWTITQLPWTDRRRPEIITNILVEPRNVILVGTTTEYGLSASGALYRSKDDGASFTRLTDSGAPPAGVVYRIIADPNVAETVYAGVNGQGAFMSTDAGLTWTAMPAFMTSDHKPLATAGGVELAAGTSGSGRSAKTVLYAAVSTGVEYMSTATVFQYVPDAKNPSWTNLGSPTVFPTDYGDAYASANSIVMTVDTTDPSIFYIASQGNGTESRGGPIVAGHDTPWTVLNYEPVGNTYPHADNRHMAMWGTTLVESNDGGIYYLIDPTSYTDRYVPSDLGWQSLIGNLAVNETNSATFDPVSGVVLSASQDNGVNYQLGPGSPTSFQQKFGDDFLTMVDATSTPGVSTRFGLGNNFNVFDHIMANSEGVPLNAPVGVITGVAGETTQQGSLIVVTSPGHRLSTGQRIAISGVLGTIGHDANGSWTVTVIDADHFSLDNSSYTGGTYLGNGSYYKFTLITSIDSVSEPDGSSEVVVTTRTPHFLQTGDQVSFSDIPSGPYYGLNYYQSNNYTAYMITVTDATHYILTGVNMQGSQALDGTGAYWSPSEWVTLKSSIGAPSYSALDSYDLQSVQSSVYSEPTAALNGVDPRLLMAGDSGLYEDNNPDPSQGQAGDVVADITSNLPGYVLGTDRITAIAYGGFRAGKGYSNVALIGTDYGKVYWRGETSGVFTQAATPTDGTITSIAVDPTDWRRVTVIQSGTDILFTPDITSVPFRSILGNLPSLTSKMNSVAAVDATPGEPGGTVLILGGSKGAYRLLTDPADLSQAVVWQQLGTGLPNAQVFQISATPQNGSVQITAALFGRGAWTLNNFTGLDQPGILQVNDDGAAAGTAATIQLAMDAKIPESLDVTVNGVLDPISPVPLSAFQSIAVTGSSGDDTLILDESNGTVSVPGGITFQGQAGPNTIAISGGQFSAEAYVPAGPGAGQLVLDGTSIDFTNVPELVSNWQSQSFTFQAPDNLTNLALVNGPIMSGIQTAILEPGNTPSPGSLQFAPLVFANKANLTIRVGAAGVAVDRTIGLKDGATPTGLMTMSLLTGDGNDNVTVGSLPVATTIATGGGNDFINFLAGSLAAGRTVALDGESGFNTIALDAGGQRANVSPSSITLSNGAALSLANFGALSVTNATGGPLALEGQAPPINTIVSSALTPIFLGSFFAPNSQASTSSFITSIDWGDGTRPTAGSLVREGSTIWGVLGSHAYGTAGTYSIKVDVTQLPVTATTIHAGTIETVADPGGEAVALTARAVVAGSLQVLSAGLDPASDTGVSNPYGITRLNRPTYIGTATPGATIQLFALRKGATRSNLVGLAVAASDGRWSITTATLVDGIYSMTVMASSAAGYSGPPTPVASSASGGPLIVDTRAPSIKALSVRPLRGQIRIVIQPGYAGLDRAGLMDLASYQWLSAAPSSVQPPVSAVRVKGSSGPNRSQAVILTIGKGTRIPSGRYVLSVFSRGIMDRAGNPLDGSFTGKFPTGAGASGSDFRALIQIRRNSVSLRVGPPVLFDPSQS